MKIELGFSFLSKTASLLGIDIETQNGMYREDNFLYREELVQVRIGIIFAYVLICFVTKGEQLEIQIKEHTEK